MTKPRRRHPKEFVTLDPELVRRMRTEYRSDVYWLDEKGPECREYIGKMLAQYDRHEPFTQQQQVGITNILNYNASGRESGRFLSIPLPPVGHPRPVLVPPSPRVRTTQLPPAAESEKEPLMPEPQASTARKPVMPVTKDQIAEAWNLRGPSRINTLIRQGKFPPPLQETGRRLPRWSWDEVQDWYKDHADLLQAERLPRLSRADGIAAFIERINQLEQRVAALEAARAGEGEAS